jgi:hypothetical protein
MLLPFPADAELASEFNSALSVYQNRPLLLLYSLFLLFTRDL